MNSENKHITDRIVWFFRDNNKDIFETIYKRNLWESKESVSGKGSEKAAVQSIIRELPLIFEKYGIKSLIDAPCGDYQWMSTLKYKFEKYLGVDIVGDLILKNREKYAASAINFECADITDYEFPDCDAVLCRDCFIHLPFSGIFCALENFKNSNAKYFLTTTFKNVPKNLDIYAGGYRKLDFTKPPFNFPAPVCEIFEDKSSQKFLAMWRFEDL